MLPRGWAALAIVAALATSGRAQVASDELGIERFRLAMDRAGILDVEWAGVPGHLSWGAGVFVGFAHAPLVLYDQQMTAVDPVVDSRVTTSIAGSIALWNRLELGVAVDVIGYQSGTELSAEMRALPARGIGDIRIIAKGLVASSGRYSAALVPALTVPGGSARGYLREAGVAFSPALAVSARFTRLRAAVNAGYHVRPRVATNGLVSDDEAFARIGTGFALGQPARPVVELWWSTSIAAPFGDRERNQIAVEMIAGVSKQITPTLGAFGAFGFGLDNGFGTPDWRALAGVRFELPTTGQPRAPERDGDSDGIVDERDRCATVAEDKDGFEDDDGCADADDDRDGVADAQDRCPAQAEDKDGFQDSDGCADRKSQVAGRVVDADGRSIAGAAVRITQLELPGSAPLELVADADGRFATELDGGGLQIVAKATEYKETTADASVAPGTTGEIIVTLVRAVRQGQLRGQVLSFDGQPLSATITVKGKTTASATAGEDGLFTIELPAGAFSVEISATGHVTQKRSISIKLDGVTVLNVDLRSSK